MSRNTKTVETYIDGFNKSDHAQILSCLTDDIDWTVFGFFRLHGKEAYDREIENPAFAGTLVSIVRMVEQDDVVMAEMTLEVRRSSGDLMRAAMAEVFVIRDGEIGSDAPMSSSSRRTTTGELPPGGDHRVALGTLQPELAVRTRVRVDEWAVENRR